MARAAPDKRRLNDLVVRRLKPKPRPYLVWDQLQRGLAVRIEPSGYRSWKCIYQFAGRPRWFHLAACDAVGIADARALAAKVMYQVAEGKDRVSGERNAVPGRSKTWPSAIWKNTQKRKTKVGNSQPSWCSGICCRDGARC
jgi:hypothetical protein